MSSLEPSLQQAVLDEWDARCETQTIRHPAALLLSLCMEWAGMALLWQEQGTTHSRMLLLPLLFPFIRLSAGIARA